MWFSARLLVTPRIAGLSGAVAGLVMTAVGAANSAAAQSFTPASPPFHSCSDTAARRAAIMTFLEVKLAIDDDQRPAWEAFVQGVFEATEDEQAVCIAMEGSVEQPTARAALLGMLLLREAALSASLQSLRKFRRAFESLLPALRQDQQEQLSYLLIVPGM